MWSPVTTFRDKTPRARAIVSLMLDKIDAHGERFDRPQIGHRGQGRQPAGTPNPNLRRGVTGWPDHCNPFCSRSGSALVGSHWICFLGLSGNRGAGFFSRIREISCWPCGCRPRSAGGLLLGPVWLVWPELVLASPSERMSKGGTGGFRPKKPAPCPLRGPL